MKKATGTELEIQPLSKSRQGSHSILKLKIKENRGDSRRNFVKFEDNLEKNQGESRRFSKVNFSKDKKDKIKDTVTGVLK